MITKRLLIIIALFIGNSVTSQVVIVPTGIISASIVPEHGFLPGKKFKFYPTITKYDFFGKKFRVELFDDREILKLKKIQCSELEFTNTSEFSDPNCIFKISQYIDTLFKQSNAILDTTAYDTLVVTLEGIDARLLGHGYVRVHGLCQMKIKYHDFNKTYCIDITDKDHNSPISPNAFVTRLTATRIMASISMREIIEQIFLALF
ncbi:MAG: hypothetical protein ISS19_18595 [Bacteroidales bacterium]|nr:hypothetical protein [Bacteroidales bacterium]